MDEENNDLAKANDSEKENIIAEKKKEIESAVKIAKDVETGNYLGAAKEAIKSGLLAKQIKRFFISLLIKILFIAIIVSIISSAVFSLFNTMKNEMIDIMPSLGTRDTGFFSRLYRKIFDDYWIDLEEDTKRNYYIDRNTGKTLAYEDEGDIVVVNRDNLDELAQKNYGKHVYDLGEEEIKALSAEYVSTKDIITKEYDIVEAYIKDLGDQGISIKDLRLLGNANYESVDEILENKENAKLVKKYISEFIRADIITQQLHKRHSDDKVLVNPNNQNEVDGGIFLYRTVNDAAESIDESDFTGNDYHDEKVVEQKDYVRMQYIEYSDFTSKLEANDIGLQYKFSINDDGELVVVEIEKTEEKEVTIVDGSSSTENIPHTPILTEKIIPYRDYTAKYAMPYEFLINLCEITQNPEFVYHVALLARNTDIALVLQDSETIHTVVKQVDKEQWYFKNDSPSIPSDPESGPRFITTIHTTKTTTLVPIPQIEYADSWHVYEEFSYIRNIDGKLEKDGPKETTPDRPSELPYAGDHTDADGHTTPYYAAWITTKQFTTTTNITINTSYKKMRKNPVRKSKQFLGMLRNKDGKCPYDCFENPEEDEDPTALKCMEEAVFEKSGTNVKYRIPNMSKTEAPLNKFQSGLDMLYAILQSNSSGYKEKDEILSDVQDSQEIDSSLQGYILNNDYESVYIVKMQAILEYIRYLHIDDLDKAPPNEHYIKKWTDEWKFEEDEYEEVPDEEISDDYIVKTDEEGALPEVSTDELKQIIMGTFKGQQQANALSIVNALISSQNSQKVNPVFMLAITKWETSMGTRVTRGENNWTNNGKNPYSSPGACIEATANNIASHYFSEGRITIAEIGFKYCPNEPAHPHQADAWIKKITNEVISMYSKIGKNVGPGHGGRRWWRPAVDGGEYPGDGTGQGIAETARAMADDNNYYYLWGGKSGYGLDCSGFTYQAYLRNGKSIPTSTAGLYSKYHGTAHQINLANIQPGDILYRGGHVAIYLGEGQIAHASTGDKKVPKAQQVLVATYKSGSWLEAYRP